MRNRATLKLGLIRALPLTIAAIAALAANAHAGGAQSQLTGLQAPLTPPAAIPAPPQGGSAIPLPAIQEYRVGKITVIGAKYIKPEFLAGSLGLVSGEVFDESRLRKGLEDLKKLYGSLGYATFLPTPVMDFDEQRKVVNLTVNVEEGRQFKINRITLLGNTVTPDEVIRREITLREGYIFNSQAMEVSRLRLNQLGLVEQIQIEDFWVEPSPTEAKLDIILTVKEKVR